MESGTSPLNPWLSMWIRPRQTIQQIVDTRPQDRVLLLAALSGFSQALDRASVNNSGDTLTWPVIILAAAIAGPITGIIGLYVGGVLIRWTGQWLGGSAPSEHVRAAIAWSSVPIIWVLPLWVPELALFGQELFTSETPNIEAKPSLALLLLAFAALEITAGIWGLVLLIQALGQVQGFSAWRALGNVCIAGLVFIVPLAVIIAGVSALSK